jgi:hypothetical protein
MIVRAVGYLHFFDKSCIRLGVGATFISAHRRTRMKEIYTQVGIITFDRLGYIFDGRNVVWNGYSKDWHNYSFIFTVCNEKSNQECENPIIAMIF